MQLTKPLSDGLAVVLVIFLVVEIVVGLVGNLKVCLILYKRRELRKVPHILLGQLSVAGLLTNATFNPALLTAVLMEQFFDRPSPTALCTLRYSTSFFCQTLDSLTLVAMAVDRHDCVCRPYKRFLTTANVKKAVMAIWVAAVALTVGHVPLAYGDMKNGCMVYGFRHYVSARYVMILTNILILITCISIFTTMFRVVGKLRSSQFPSQSNQRAERKVTKLSLGVMAAYAISLLPLITFSIVTSAAGLKGSKLKGPKLFTLAFSTLNFVVNPFLHAEMCKVEQREQVESTRESDARPQRGRGRVNPSHEDASA